MRDAVSWNGRGRPASSSASTSPSSTNDFAGSDSATATTSGSRAVMSSSDLVATSTLGAVAVHLDADAVELGVDGDLAAAGLGQRLGDRRRAGRQHRQHRPTDLEPDGAQGGLASRERRPRDRDRRPGEHRGAAHVRERYVGGDGEPLLDQRVERALPHRAGDHAAQPRLLVGGRPAEQLGHGGRPRRLRAGAGERGEAVERLVHLEHGQGRRRRGSGSVAEPPPPQTGPPLAQRAADVRRHGLDLVGGGALEQVGDRRDLRLARAGGGDRCRGGDDVGEQHLTIQVDATDITVGAMDVRRWALGIENAWDSARLRHRSRKPPKSFRIETYLGYGGPAGVVVGGRVLDDPPPSEAEDGEGVVATIRRSVGQFFTNDLPDVPLRVTFGETSIETRTDHDGYFVVRFVPEAPTGPWLDGTVELTTDYRGLTDRHVTPLRILVPGPAAKFGIVSDIDDTILETGVQRVWQMVRATFTGSALTRTPFDGAPELYRDLAAGVNPVFYVSSSPWNLYGFLRHFLRVVTSRPARCCSATCSAPTRARPASTNGSRRCSP